MKLGAAVTSLIAALAGLLAAFSLTVEKLARLNTDGAATSCDVNLLVQCSANLDSWQGSLFGFPNPLIGLIGWPVAITLLILMLSGAKIPKWIMRGLNIGMVGAYAFVLWLMYVSFWQLGTLCPWCMVTWISTITAATLIWTGSFDDGVWSSRKPKESSIAFWSPTLIVLQIAIVAAVAQVQLNWLTYAFV